MRNSKLNRILYQTLGPSTLCDSNKHQQLNIISIVKYSILMANHIAGITLISITQVKSLGKNFQQSHQYGLVGIMINIINSSKLQLVAHISNTFKTCDPKYQRYIHPYPTSLYFFHWVGKFLYLSCRPWHLQFLNKKVFTLLMGLSSYYQYILTYGTLIDEEACTSP